MVLDNVLKTFSDKLFVPLKLTGMQHRISLGKFGVRAVAYKHQRRFVSFLSRWVMRKPWTPGGLGACAFSV